MSVCVYSCLLWGAGASDVLDYGSGAMAAPSGKLCPTHLKKFCYTVVLFWYEKLSPLHMRTINYKTFKSKKLMKYRVNTKEVYTFKNLLQVHEYS
jgi:hypothetical protein